MLNNVRVALDKITVNISTENKYYKLKFKCLLHCISIIPVQMYKYMFVNTDCKNTDMNKNSDFR